MKNAIYLLAAAVAAVAVCQPVQAAAKREPPPNLDRCVAAVLAWDITVKHDIASFMGVSQERMPALFCQRIAEGIRSGRISYSDANRLQLNLPTEIWMVIKGKPKPAAVTQAPAPKNPKFRYCTGIDGTFQVPVSQKCPLSGYAHAEQPTKMDTVRSTKPASAPRNPKFRTCSNVYSGSFEIPASRTCPSGGG